MALTTSKDFRIAPCIAEISGWWKCPLGLNHPVYGPARTTSHSYARTKAGRDLTLSNYEQYYILIEKGTKE